MDHENLILQLKALGEPNRLALVLRLAEGERGGSELLKTLQMSQPSLSRHLKLLREAGVVEERRQGRNAYYCLQDNDLSRAVVAAAGGVMRFGGGSGMADTEQMHGSAWKPRKKMPPPASLEDSPPSAGDDEPQERKPEPIEEWLL